MPVPPTPWIRILFFRHESKNMSPDLRTGPLRWQVWDRRTPPFLRNGASVLNVGEPARSPTSAVIHHILLLLTSDYPCCFFRAILCGEASRLKPSHLGQRPVVASRGTRDRATTTRFVALLGGRFQHSSMLILDSVRELNLFLGPGFHL
jgi:hypothetical protein